MSLSDALKSPSEATSNVFRCLVLYSFHSGTPYTKYNWKLEKVVSYYWLIELGTILLLILKSNHIIEIEKKEDKGWKEQDKLFWKDMNLWMLTHN